MMSTTVTHPQRTPTAATPPVARTILVTDAARASAVSIIRSLGRQGCHVIAADSSRRSPGFRSRYAAEQFVYPAPQQNPSAFVAALEQFTAERPLDLLIPVTDETLLPLAAAQARFDGRCRLAIPHVAALDVTTNKHKTLELARELGVPVPRTAVVETAAGALAAAATFSWPIVLKPLSSRLCTPNRIERLEVTYARDTDDLRRRMAGFEGRCSVLLQEYVAGEGCGVEVLASKGRCLAVFQHRRLREVPITGGASSYRQSVPLNPDLFDYTRRLIRGLDWTGLAMVEFKVGPDGPRLMEINGRVWGSIPLAIASGMDFPARLADLYLGDEPTDADPPDTNYRIGVRARNLELEIIWIGSVLFGRRRHPFLPVPRRWRALPVLLSLLDPTCRSDMFSPGDPGPAIADVGRIAGKLWNKLIPR